MSMMGEGTFKQLTDIHRKVSKRIERIGISVRDEVPFPPYTVDIYLDEYHAVVEIDGPHHNKKRDDKRDDYLWEHYRLHILHILIGEAKKASHVKKIVLEFVNELLEYDSIYEREKHAEEYGGWQL